MEKGFRNYEAYALVTGAASGMGRIYASRLARKGYNLVIVDINADGLAETERIVREEVASVQDMASDVRDRFSIVTVRQDLSLVDAADSIYARTEAGGGCLDRGERYASLECLAHLSGRSRPRS